MKKYLLTWYGITDLRAALGLETSEGPVLSALLAEEYTDVIILGYTNPEKEKQDNHILQQELLAWCQNADMDEILVNQAKGWRLVDVYSNISQGHELYSSWLSSKLEQLGKTIKGRVVSVHLKRLNDTEGIYKAVNKCLDTVASDEGEKSVTLYLSPGTPVMAFTWAFAALVNPALKTRVIASSDARIPPESITLPYQLLEQSNKKASKTVNHTEFDVIFHLFGEQRMPSVLGVLQFKSKKHIFVNSPKYPAGIMKQFIGDSEFMELSVNAFDPKKVEAKILEKIAKFPPDFRIGFNLTGGTKLMYAGALSALEKTKGTAFYFETKNHNMIFLNDFSVAETKPIENVETFINANTDGITISNGGLWNDDTARNNPQRRSLTFQLWESRNKISKLYFKLKEYNNEPGALFNVSKGNIQAELTSGNKARITIGAREFTFSDWADFAKYLSGGWLEEYSYLALEPFVATGQIKDLRIGLEVSYTDNYPTGSSLDFKDQLRQLTGETFQELDVVFTDGKQLFVVECKAGNVQSEHVMKLQNIVRYFGGNEARGILASAFPPYSKVTKKKIIEANNLSSIAGRNLPFALRDMVNSLR